MRTVVSAIVGLAVVSLATVGLVQQLGGGPRDRATQARAEKGVADLGYLLRLIRSPLAQENVPKYAPDYEKKQ
jgi:hypothetical protein